MTQDYSSAQQPTRRRWWLWWLFAALLVAILGGLCFMFLQVRSLSRVIAVARSLIETPRGRRPIPWAPDFTSASVKTYDHVEVARLLSYDVFDCTQRGYIDQALRSAHAILHCGCSIGDEPAMASQEVRIACLEGAIERLERVLAQGEPSAELLLAFQQRIENEEPFPSLLCVLRNERAGRFRILQVMQTGRFPTGPGMMPNTGEFSLAARVMPVPGAAASQLIGFLEYMNHVIEIAKLTPEQWTEKYLDDGERVQRLPKFARMVAPRVTILASSAQTIHARMRCAIVVIAAERFRREKNRWPNSLDDLVATGFLKSVPMDPHSGEPLRFKQTEFGLIVYSVGEDQMDDDGVLWNPRGDRMNTDLALRLWKPDLRRQPAPRDEPDRR